MKKVFIIIGTVLLNLLILTSCGGGNSKEITSNALKSESIQINNSIKSGKIIAASNPKKRIAQKSTLQLLQGKWQSTDDKTNFLIFENNHRKEANIINGKGEWDDEVFVISNKCMNTTDKNEELDEEKDKYMSCLKSDLCWYIVELDSATLSLSYMGRGNTLTYKKVK
ncbi:MAG: hypothetical protein HXX14_13700 [Bacteroidetes bacterium]|nr:hypothetical protein [Bacteroidota bacterium]